MQSEEQVLIQNLAKQVLDLTSQRDSLRQELSKIKNAYNKLNAAHRRSLAAQAERNHDA